MTDAGTGEHRFVVSAGRAGSTFLARALNMHPDVFCLVESHHLPLLIDAFGTQSVSPQAHLAVLMTARFHGGEPVVEWNLRRLNAPRSAWFAWTRELIDAGGLLSVAEFQRAFEGFWLRWSGKTIFVDKTPCYGLDLPRLRDALGSVRAAHLVRDVLPSIKSMAAHPGFRVKVRAGEVSWTDILRRHDLAALDGASDVTGAEMTAMARLWAARTGEPIREAERIGQSLEILRYEDLVADPKAFFGRLADSLAIPREGLWLEMARDLVKPSRTPTSFESAPNFAALAKLDEVAATRALCGY